jgi:hypothetical protein
LKFNSTDETHSLLDIGHGFTGREVSFASDGFGTGMTSEQSTMLAVFCPITASLAIAARNSLCIFAWLSGDRFFSLPESGK